MQRLRITYSKGNELMFTGNLDMQKVWERTFRRADLELAYSQGFHPQPRMHQACPLPLGFTSENELVDFWLNSDESITEVLRKLKSALQPGITILDLRPVSMERKALQTLVTAAKYRVFFDEEVDLDGIEALLTNLKNKKNCIRTRRGKEYDLLPLIQDIVFVNEKPAYLDVTLSAVAGATGRPEEVLDELGFDFTETSIIRTGLILSE
ncbi:MAG TPA: TIGR03936 family radical SAM-associated protein [Anaerolineaceae bacterium]|nr:TIGR03936 family radical SAM-associated protein [Anaerolineaceae bacterium]